MQDKLSFHFNEFLQEFKAQITEDVAMSVIDSLRDYTETLSQSRPTSEVQYVTLTQLASIFTISKSQINKLRQKHKDFPLVKAGTTVRFNPEEVKVFLNKHYNN